MAPLLVLLSSMKLCNEHAHSVWEGFEVLVVATAPKFKTIKFLNPKFLTHVSFFCRLARLHRYLVYVKFESIGDLYIMF